MSTPRNDDRNGFGIATTLFAFLTVMLALAALVVAGQAWSKANDTGDRVTKLASGGLLGRNVKVTLEEYTITPHPNEVKAGAVRFEVDNVGTMTHEMVVVRAASPAALPKVTVSGGERAVGDVDEEVIPAADKVGETGDVKQGGHVLKTFKLTPGTYVLFCNIDDTNPDGTVTSHFQQGMSATLTVR